MNSSSILLIAVLIPTGLIVALLFPALLWNRVSSVKRTIPDSVLKEYHLHDPEITPPDILVAVAVMYGPALIGIFFPAIQGIVSLLLVICFTLYLSRRALFYLRIIRARDDLPASLRQYARWLFAFCLLGMLAIGAALTFLFRHGSA